MEYRKRRKTMKLLFTGDVNFRCKENITFEESKNVLAGVMPYFEAADYTIVNLECPLSDDNSSPIKKSGPPLISPSSCICFLEAGKVDGATLANNHIGDYGEQPVIDTLKLLDSKNIKHCGADRNLDEAYKAMYFEKDGIKVSVLSMCENEFGVAKKDRYGSAGFNVTKAFHAIKREKELADYVIVVFHGGNEQNPLPSPGAIERYKLLCDFGADAIVAGHTHCPQPAIYYSEKPIIFSLGNFFFKSFSHSEATDPWFYGYMVKLDVTKDGIKYELIPYRSEDDVTKIRVFEGEEKKAMLEYLDGLAKIVQDEDELLKHYKGWVYHIDFYWPRSPLSDPEGMERIVPSKNLVTCEAHNELVRTNYCLYIDEERELGAEYWEKVQRLMIMPV